MNDVTLEDYERFQLFLEQSSGISPGDNKHYLERVIDAMTTNETLWFRDVQPFEVFKRTILPELALRQKRTLRFWSAACSSGRGDNCPRYIRFHDRGGPAGYL